MTPLCKKCFTGIEAESYRELIEKSAASIPQRDRSGDGERERRFRICEGCEKLVGATCQACGCYVELRALRKASHCPHKKW